MKPLVIVNPAAGGGRAGRTLDALRPIVERALGPVDLAITTRRGHGIVLARDAAGAGRELIVAVGGDGTWSEVANGVLDAGAEARERTAVGLIAVGTGGDFRKSIGLEHRLDRYLAAIASGRERRIDAGRATFRSGGAPATRWFVNILSVGLGGLVDRFVADAPRALSPTLAYSAAAARAIAASESVPLLCSLERGGVRREESIDAWSVAICNGGTFGAGMRIAPMAAVDDGRLEVVALQAPSRLALLALSASVYRGSHLGSQGVRHWAAERAEIGVAAGRSGKPVPLDIDGEALGELPLKVEIARRALRLRA